MGFEPTCPAHHQTTRFRVGPVTSTSVLLHRRTDYNEPGARSQVRRGGAKLGHQPGDQDGIVLLFAGHQGPLTGLGPVQHALRTMSGPEGSSIKKVSMCAADPPGPDHPAEVPRFINMMTFAEGACEARSRSEEEAMQGHRRRQGTQRSPATPSARRVAAGRHRFLCPSSSAMRTDISSSSLRELDAVALATNVTVL